MLPLKASVDYGSVSNLNNSIMRCRPLVPCLLKHCGGLAWNSRLYESQIIELSRACGPGEGQQNNRNLNEPCARRQIRFNSESTLSSIFYLLEF